MRTATLVSLGASAVLGVGALLVAKVWLPQSSAQHGNRVTANSEATVPVVVARGEIPYGTKLDAGRLQVTRVPLSAAPQGAYATISQVIAQPGGAPLVLVPISAREAVLPTKLSGGGAKPTLAAVISEGMRGFTIGVTEVAGGGGHVLPGDRIDVVLTRDLSTLAGAPAGGGKRLVSNVVIQDVRVLGMDLNADPTSTAAAIAHTATLEVSVEDAEKLALAAQAGTLSLALRRTGSTDIAVVRPVGNGDLGAGVGGVTAIARPVLIQVRHRAPRAAPPMDHHEIIVVHGETKSSVDVPYELRSGL
ncbi:MAG TPA: Flp pilus assembly protein CpaB [Caulobacteraceae bacterium]